MSDPTPKLSRLARLGSLTGRITSSYVGQKLKGVLTDEDARKRAMQKLHIDNARHVVETVSQMKGAAMKLGQQLAVATSAMDLPPEVASMLGKLHAEAEPIPFEHIQQDVEKSLGKPLTTLFASFDRKPLGTASLAQAHAATLHDGTRVVVKVLHRGISENVATDLMALKAVILSSRALKRDPAEMDAIFEELRERLEEELDYLHEAKNLLEFGQAWANHPDIRIPRLFPEFSTDRVLTMDHLPGVPIDKFAATASPAAKQRAGNALAELYFKSVYVHRMLHSDPHPGNYLFDEDGRVGVLDFGCVKRFDEFWIAHYASAAMAAIAGDKQACLDGCRAIDGWMGETPEAGDRLWDFIETMAVPFREKGYELGGPADDVLDQLPATVKAVMRYPEVRAPKDLIMLHRALTGLYTMGRKLRVRGDWGAISEAHATHAIAYAKGWAT